MNKEFIKHLQCPLSGGVLTLSDDGQYLISAKANCRYPIENGIALLLNEHGLALSETDEDAMPSTNPAQDG